jgi:hypothetical protein
VPFTGDVEGLGQGKFKSGKQEGSWVHYFEGDTVPGVFSGVYKNDVKISD